jgi:16S rRNA (cytosine967-C5)-methyltransferase
MSARSATEVAPARAVAHLVVRAVFANGAFADRTLHRQSEGLSARDRQLAMRLAYGTVQRRMTLDHLIERLSDRPASKLDQVVLSVLRMGLYELCYMDGAPDRAVVNDAVALARQGGSQGHGLVNAVLRRGARDGPGLLGELSDQSADQAAVMHSHPLWIAQMWFSELGADHARALLAAGNQPAETALRVNTLCVETATVAAELPVPSRTDPDLPEALVIDGPFDAYGSPAWRAGAFTPQSRASMLVAHVLDPKPGERVLDLCAAPGGKSTHLAALMGGQGEVVAVDRSSRRAGALERNAQRMHAHNVRVEVADATLTRAQGDLFDRVLVDPPCSGLGTLGSHPDLRWRMNQQEVLELAGVQRAILDSGAGALRPGGVLVYSTCTISQTENERQIAAFLDRHPDFHVDPPPPRLRAPAHPSPGAGDFVLTLPHRDRTQGFFIARLRRD